MVEQMPLTDRFDSPVLEAIYRRRSIREFTAESVEIKHLHEIIRAGSWAPSGLNNQPWRFVIIRDQKIKNDLAAQTSYSHIVKNAAALIAVYLDTKSMYNDVKDHQAVGACIQNMLLTIEALGLGAVWLGQIITNKNKVNSILELDNNLDLMAVLAIGHPLHHNQKSDRKTLNDLILNEF